MATVNAETVQAGANLAGLAAETSAVAERGEPAWAARSVAERARVLAGLRHRLAADPERWVEALGRTGHRGRAESMATEVMSLAAACGWIGKHAARTLRPRRLSGWGAPLWLWGTRGVVRREPVGHVLVIGPGNYPLFLPGVQVIQALAAGNTVSVKPAPGSSAAMELLADELFALGVPRSALTVLDEDPAGLEAVWPTVDLAVLTGSEATGRVVRERCAALGVPCVMELSGCDAAFVLDGADVDLAARSVAFGLMVNGSATCIAPRRVLVAEALHDRFVSALLDKLRDAEPVAVSGGEAAWAKARRLAERAVAGGAERRAGGLGESFSGEPVVLTGVSPNDALMNADVFAPVLSVVAVRDVEHALAVDAGCGFALGASVFGPERAAVALAERIDAGSVTVNDLIVPTADPRLPFAARGRSGYGVTRGAEGLLGMTRVKAVSVRRANGVRPHLRPTDGDTLGVLAALLRFTHARRWRDRLGAGVALLKLSRQQARRQGQGQGSPPSSEPRP